MIKRLIYVIILFLFISCSKKEEIVVNGDNVVEIYYLKENNKEVSTTIVDLSIDNVNKNKIEKIYDYILKLSGSDDEFNKINLLSYEKDNRVLILNFSREYKELSKLDMVLFNSILAKTYIGLDGIKSIDIFIDNEKIINLKSTDYIYNKDDNIAFCSNFDVSLYFGSNGKLVERSYRSNYDGKESIEYYILKLLIKGPNKKSNLSKTINPKTKIIKCMEKDGICFVYLNDKFLDFPKDVTEEMSIYSIVNTLTKLKKITKVKIYIKDIDYFELFKEKYKNIKNPYFERNLSIVEKN